jgi:acetoacetyl-CoA reductase/3-oxoacyl-[acyl-carrier protein] reductase
VTESPAARLSLKGRVALVAGGAGGIGSAVCTALVSAGARVVCADRDGSTPPPGVRFVACDVRDPPSVAEVVSRIEREWARLDVLVHCAGVTRDGLLWKLTNEDWTTVVTTNLDSAFYLLRAAVPLMRQIGGGAVALVSSINGERGKTGQANYSASKAGLNTLARTAARELGRFNIRVNSVAPGWVDTPMTAKVSDTMRQRAIRETALGRLAEPEDIANAVLFVCSDLGRHVTGQVIRVDGGQLIG